ncbi:MAG TPA: CapA family protein [Gemmatimonadales bacterium]|nr:CapA family protein [Gemmatimonadales bacterium]
MRRTHRWLLLLAGLGCARATPPPQTVPEPQPAPRAEPVDTVVPADSSPLLEPVPAPRLYAPVRLAFVGDINLGTATLPDGVPPDSGRGLLERARLSLAGDLVVGNFEGVLADTGVPTKCLVPQSGRKHRKRTLKPGAVEPPPATRPNCYAFRTPTLLAPRLVEAGFTHMNLANNHANDLGLGGRQSTEQTLQSLGVRLYGPLGMIATDTIKRGDSLTTVALIGFTTYPYAYNLLDIERSAAVVDSIRPLVDLLLVTFHGGAEGVNALHTAEAAESLGREPRGDLRRWARAVIDAGADAVIGHGPHVLRGMEFYRDRLIAYSLGNFATYRGFNVSGPLGVTGVLQLEFSGERTLRTARLVPMKQLPRQGPFPDPDSTAIQLIRRLSAEDFGLTAAVITDSGEILPPARSRKPSPEDDGGS